MTESPLDPHDAAVSELYRELFELSPMPMAVIGRDGVCRLFNRAFVERLGYDRQAWLDGSVRFEALFDDDAAARQLMADIQAGQIIRRREVELRHRDGTRSAALLFGRALEVGQPGAIEVILVNITHQKDLEHELRRGHARMASLIDGLTFGLFLVDVRGLVSDLNDAAAERLGADPAALIGRPHHELFERLIAGAAEREVTRHTLNQAVASVTERPVVLVEIGPDDRRVSLEIALFPVWGETDEPSGWGGLIQDVTDAHNRLAWKLELLAILAHDIRAPLAALKGHATALLANYRQWNSAMVLEFLEAINRRTDELVRQVDRSLALTRVEAGRLGLRPELVEPGRLIQQAVERIGDALGEARVVIDAPPGLPAVQADPARAEEVLINLLDNAARHTPSDQAIGVSARAEGAWLQLSVTDRGPGVPAEEQHHIFDKYARAGPAAGAAGLGLFICRKIVEAHGGRLWVESPLADGSPGARFSFTLPLAPAPGAAREPRPQTAVRPRPAARAQAGGPARVLVVEDEPDYQALLHAALTQAGYDVQLATDGLAAIDLVQSAAPDLVLLDMVLPGLDGLSVCRNLRRWTNVPILVVTSRTAQADLIAALDAGADDYVTKPFQSAELLARARALLRRGEAGLEAGPDLLRVDGLAINFDSHEVWLNGRPVELTPIEYSLLAQLARHRGQVLTYNQLLDRVYAPGEGRSRHDLFVHVSRLRKKIEPRPSKPRFLVTRRGVGYLFAPE